MRNALVEQVQSLLDGLLPRHPGGVVRVSVVDDVLRLSTRATPWIPTGLEFAAFPDDAQHLVEDCPDLPFASVALAWPSPFDMDPLADLAGSLSVLTEGLSALKAERKRVAEECERVRGYLKTSKYSDWHIEGFDAWKSTITVFGRPLELTTGQPTGSPSDLDKIFLTPFIASMRKSAGAPRVVLVAADRGSRRVKVELGRGGQFRSGTSTIVWIDFATGKATRVRRTGQGPANRLKRYEE